MAVNCARMAIKTTKIKQGAVDKWEDIAEQFKNNNTYILQRNISDVIDDVTDDPYYEQCIFFPVQDVITVLKNAKAIFDERAGFLGWFGKDLDEKKERVTVHEGAMSTKLVNNQTETMLRELRALFFELREQFPEIPEDFDIEMERIKTQVNNTPGAEPQLSDAEQALEN